MWLYHSTVAVLTILLYFSQKSTGEKNFKDKGAIPELIHSICDRIFFQGLAKSAPYYMHYEGVYARQNNTWDGFPVYKHEQYDIYFQYSKERPNELFFGAGEGKYAGLGATFKHTDKPLLTSAVNLLSGKYSSESIVDEWIYFSPKDGDHMHIDNTDIQVKCVSKLFTHCTTGKLYIDDVIKHKDSHVLLNDPKRDYFQQLYSTYINLRPVFHHTQHADWYLFFNGKYWVIGPNYQRQTGYFYVEDSALRPEFITHTWKYYNGARWIDNANVKLLCKAVITQCTGTETCTNKGKCVETKDNKPICQCQGGYYGEQCETEIKCPPSPKVVNAAETWNWANEKNNIGDIITTFCKPGKHDISAHAVYAVCQRDHTENKGVWNFTGSCGMKLPVTETTMATETFNMTNNNRNKHDYDVIRLKHKWILPTFVITFVVFLQIIIPVLHFLVVRRLKMMKRLREAEKKTAIFRMNAMDAIGSNFNSPFPVSGTLNSKIDEFLNQTEDRPSNLKPFKGLARTVSLDLYISMCLWAIFLGVSGVTTCFTNEVFIGLQSLAWFVIVIAVIYIFIESFFCKERLFLQVLSRDGSLRDCLNTIRQSVPSIILSAECWHYELFTQTERFVDWKGIHQTRFITSQKRVVSRTDSEEFTLSKWTDLSPNEVKGAHKSGITKIKLDKMITLADDYTRDLYEKQELRFKEKNQYGDEYVNYQRQEYIPGYRKSVIVHTASKKPFWLTSFAYWFSTICLLAWPYRLFLKLNTSKTSYTIIKEVCRDPKELYADTFADACKITFCDVMEDD